MSMGQMVGDRAEIGRALEREISECTGSRIQQLRVEVTGNRVAVHGYTPWYYVKQLAIQAVLALIADSDSLELEIDIEIINRGPAGERDASHHTD